MIRILKRLFRMMAQYKKRLYLGIVLSMINNILGIVHLVCRLLLEKIIHADSARLDGDAALALEVHVVEQLLLHLADGDRLALLEQTVGKGGFAVVNMCNNREIANLLTIFHVESSLSD